MRNVNVVMIALLLAGCHTFNDPNGILVPPEQTRATARSNLNKLEIGISKEQVLQIMGEKTHHYHRLHQIPTIIPHPYKTETMSKGDRTYQILYYYTDLKKDDGAITDDELTPIVLENSRVIGWGWTFLGDNVKRFQIDIR